MCVMLCKVCVPAHHSAWGRARLTSACSVVFVKPVRSVMERIQLPVPLPARKSAAELGLVKLLISTAVRSDGQLYLQTTTQEFSPIASSPNRTNPAASGCTLCTHRADGTGGIAGIYGITMAVGCCSAGSERWLLSQLLCCWMDPLASARCLLLLTYFHQPSTWLKKLEAKAAALPGDFSLAERAVSHCLCQSMK